MDKIVKAIRVNGERIGQVEPKLGARISKLIKAGNKYKAFIRKIDGNRIKLLIREIYQHPSQIRVVSFPNINSQNNRESQLYETLQISQKGNADFNFDLNEEESILTNKEDSVFSGMINELCTKYSNA